MPKVSKAKKLILVLAISASITGASKEAPEIILDQILCIYYPVQFRKNKKTIWALINFNSELNAITPAYAKKLDLWTQRTDIRV